MTAGRGGDAATVRLQSVAVLLDENRALRGEVARLEAELRTADLDDLTGVYRRSAGALALTHELDRARRLNANFLLAFVDVDGLKHVNDSEGHALGDEVLRCLAATLRANLRSFDPIVRSGGDEFVCGMGSMSMRSAEARFRRVDSQLMRLAGAGISFGLAALDDGETLDHLTSRADAQLFHAKERHRR